MIKDVYDTLWDKESKIFFIPIIQTYPDDTILIKSKDRIIPFKFHRRYATYALYKLGENPFLQDWYLMILYSDHPRFTEVCSILEKRKDLT